MKVLGIDLGTSSSAAAVLMDGKIRIVMSSEKNTTTAKPFPSIVSFFENHGCLIGSAASEQSVYNPRGTISNIKRRMGTGEKIKVFGKAYLPEFISALLLMKIKIDAEKFLNKKITKAVITVPANFNDVQRQATKDAGKIAGLDVVRLMAEPVAAAVAYGTHRDSNSGKILVFDMGAGTLDVSLVEVDGGFFEVMATSGPTNIGGIDMDVEVERWLLSEFKKCTGFVGSLDEQSMAQIRELAKRLKVELSEKQEVLYDEILFSGKTQSRFSGKITRVVFEDLISHIITESEITIMQVMKNVGATPADIDRVIPVGGPTKIPAIQKMLARAVKVAEVGVDPDFTVSSGAAIEGAILANEQNLPVPYRGLTLLNVTPLDLGEEAKEKDRHKIILMIPKNTPYPTEHTSTFFVNNMMQVDVNIGIWQGDFKQCPGFTGNVNIGTFMLHGLRPGMQNEIDVTYGIDDDGIITVRAREVGTDTEQELIVDRAWGESRPPPQLEHVEEEIKHFEKKYRDILSPYEIPVAEYVTPDTGGQKLKWMCKCLLEAKNILKTHHKCFDPTFFDTAQFELFLQLDRPNAFAYIRLTGGPVYPIGVHNMFKEKTVQNQRSLVITLVHEVLHAIHPDWGHDKIRPEERRLANLAGYFDTYRENDLKFLSGQMSFCNNSMTGGEKRAKTVCYD